MTTDRLSVTIVGAGIGGLSAALLLGRIGASVTLIDRTPEPAAAGAGLLLQPNGLAVLTALGITDLGGTVQSDAVLRNGAGRALTSLSIPDFGGGLDHVLAVRRSVLHEALLAALHQEPTVRCLFGATAVGADRNGSVDVDDRGRRHTVLADLVIGADGVGSVLRSQGDFGVHPRRRVARYLRALVPRDPSTPLNGEYWTSLGLFGGAPLDARAQYIFADADAPAVAAALAAGDLQALRSVWRRVLPLAGTYLDHVDRVDDLLVNVVSEVVCDRWVDHRLVLLGDAAHAMAPNAGQGANSALVDAAVLVGELVSSPLREALSRYENRRQGPVRRVQRQSSTLARMSSLRSPAGRTVRDIALRAFDRPASADRIARRLQQEDPAALLAATCRLQQSSPRHPPVR